MSIDSPKTAEKEGILSYFEGKTVNEKDFIKEDGGRPFFIDRHSDFNISHSGEVIAVSHVNGENMRTGCDVQIIKERTNTLKIADSFFSDKERDYIKDDKNKFFQIWVLKESFLKLKGLSVFDMANAPSFIDGNGSLCLRFTSDKGNLSFYMYDLEANGSRYALAAAIEGEETPEPQIKIFSDILVKKSSHGDAEK